MSPLLRIRLHWDGTRVHQVGLQREGPQQAQRLVEGRSPALALTRLPMLYAVCAEAQAVALAAALEAAWGQAPAAGRARAWLVDAEAALEGLAAEPDGGPPDLADQVELRRAWARWRRDWRPADRWLAAGGGVGGGVGGGARGGARGGAGAVAVPLPQDAADWADALADLLQRRWLGIAPAALVALAERDDGGAGLQAWAQGAGGEAAGWLGRHWRSRLAPGRLAWAPAWPPAWAAKLPPDPLPPRSPAAHASAIAQPQGCPAPEGGHELACEPGPLADEAATPALAALLARRGRRLALRWLARWLGLARTVLRLQALARGQRDAPRLATGAPHLAAGASAGPAGAAGQGWSWLATARGPLRHRVWATRERVERLQIEAPLDAMARPDGPLVMALSGLRARDERRLRQRAGLVVAALDPCVPCALELAHA